LPFGVCTLPEPLPTESRTLAGNGYDFAKAIKSGTVMNWLRDHDYIATWLGVPLSVILEFVRAKTTHFAQADWFWSIISFAFFTSFAVVITPTFDMTARLFAKYVGSFLLGVIIVSRFR
jgi:hypothetical protein